MNRIKAGKAVLNMALDAIGGADDVARAAGKAVKAPKAAAAKALDAIADTADDWGWKGGKPGEITGGEYMTNLNIKPEDIVPKLRETFRGVDAEDSDLLMQWFADMERADIPREWTGKIAKTVWESPDVNIPFDESQTGLATAFSGISDAMKRLFVKGDPELTRARRETFLGLLPGWTGSFEELATTSKALG